MEMKQIKETYINTLVDSMSLEDLQQYVRNDMAGFLYYCNEIGVIQNEFLITSDSLQYCKKFAMSFATYCCKSSRLILSTRVLIYVSLSVIFC